MMRSIDATTLTRPPLRSVRPGGALAVIALLSVGVLSFLVWLIYFKPAAGRDLPWVGYLPPLNAMLNALSTVFLITAYIAVRNRQYQRHMMLMVSALASSTAFFASYVLYHHFHGDTRFLGQGLVRPIYFFILITHITLSAVAVPLILTSLYLALSGKLTVHRKVSRFTLPIWLYVSATGVVIFFFLRFGNG